MHQIRVKRVYDEPAESDGRRVLVDRLWPRGMKKEKAAIDEWMKDVAPSTELRKWFHREPGRWDEFETRYRRELEHAQDHLATLREYAKNGPLTLLYATRDETRNHALVVMALLMNEC